MTVKYTTICLLIAAILFAETPEYEYKFRDGRLIRVPVRVKEKTVENPSLETKPAMPNDDIPIAKLLFENQDGKLAFQIFSELAEKGDIEATAWLGRCYHNGVGTVIDHNKAFACFQKAAEKNEPWAINGLGVCYEYGYGTTKNLQLAMKCFGLAADMNHPLGTLNLAKTYGDINNKNVYNTKTAETYYKKALALKAQGAESAYGTFLFDHQRYKEAIPLLNAASDNVWAWRLLIQCYENGWGTPVDIRKAVDLADRYAYDNPSDAAFGASVLYEAAWEELFLNGRTEWFTNLIKRAASHGHREAQSMYADILMEQNDLENALEYARRAADAAMPGANLQAGKLAAQLKQFDVALMYLSLAALEPSTEMEAVVEMVNIYAYQLNQRPKSRHWAQRGADIGSAYCRNELAQDALNAGTPESIAKAYKLASASRVDDNETAIKWLSDNIGKDYEMLRELADNGNTDALIALGILGCLNDKGHPNIPIGLELLEKAANLKSPEAYRYLGNIYLNGGLVDKDLQKAMTWYKKGAELGDLVSANSVALLLYSYEEFSDIPIDECKKWYDIAMKLSDNYAYEYGVILEFKGKDIESAMKMYEKAAQNKDPRALVKLHNLLWEKNPQLSRAYLRNAVDLMDVDALHQAGLFNLFVLRQPRKAFVYFIRSHIGGNNTVAPYQLAQCFLNGIGCVANLNLALTLAEEAYKNGNPQSCSLLGNLYKEGKVVTRDDAKAKQYFEEGVKRGDIESRKALTLPVVNQ